MAKKKGIDYKALQRLLITKEDEKVEKGGEQADEADLQVSTLQKLYTSLNHLEAHPKAFKLLQENFVQSETPCNWKPFHFNSSFWAHSDEVVSRVYVITLCHMTYY